MSIEYKYEKKKTYLGDVIVPRATIKILTKGGYREFKFLVDTGADGIMLPRYAADYIGIDLGSCRKERSRGIEGEGIDVYVSKIRIKFPDAEFDAQCLISERNDTPFILGRADIFDRYNVIFDNKNGKLIFERI